MFRIVSKQLTFDAERTRVLIQSIDGEYTALEREIDGNHLATPDNEVIEMVLLKVYKDSFQKYAMNDAIKQADQTAEQVVALKKTLDDSQALIEDQRKQLQILGLADLEFMTLDQLKQRLEELEQGEE